MVGVFKQKHQNNTNIYHIPQFLWLPSSPTGPDIVLHQQLLKKEKYCNCPISCKNKVSAFYKDIRRFYSLEPDYFLFI